MIDYGHSIAIILSTITFFLLIILILHKTNKKKPELIRWSLQSRDPAIKKFRYNINFLGGIALLGLAFSEAMYLICNIALLFFYGKLYLDISNLIPATITYIIFLSYQLGEFLQGYLE